MWPEKIIFLSIFTSIFFNKSISGDLEPRRARPIPIGVLVAGDVAISEVGNLRWLLRFFGTIQKIFRPHQCCILLGRPKRKCICTKQMLSISKSFITNNYLKIEWTIHWTSHQMNTMNIEHFWTHRFMPKKSAEPDIIVSSSSVKDGSLWDGGFQFEANLIGSEVLATLETRTILAKWMI